MVKEAGLQEDLAVDAAVRMAIRPAATAEAAPARVEPRQAAGYAAAVSLSQ